MKILATYNIKGGVGKTSTAVNIGHLAARDGLRVLLWDLDPQGAASFLLRVRPRVKGGGKALIKGRRELDAAIKGTDFDRLDLLPADFTYRNLDLILDSTKKPTERLDRLLRPLADEYDLIVLDCPPSISLLSESVLHAAVVLFNTRAAIDVQWCAIFIGQRVHRRLIAPPLSVAKFKSAHGHLLHHRSITVYHVV